MFGWTNNRPGSGENGAIGSGKQNWASWLKKNCETILKDKSNNLKNRGYYSSPRLDD